MCGMSNLLESVLGKMPPVKLPPGKSPLPGKCPSENCPPEKLPPQKIVPPPPKKKNFVKLPDVMEYFKGEIFVNFNFRQS